MVIKLPEDNDICFVYSPEIMLIVTEDGKQYRYIIKELSSAVAVGGTYSINLICKYAPTSTVATDIIAYHTTIIGTSYN